MAERALERATILVTGVSRRRGIGFGIASALAAAGAKLFIHHYSPHDERQPWGPDSVSDLLAELDATYPGALLGDVSVDLAAPGGPKALVEDTVRRVGRFTGLVCNHAQSGGDGSIFDADEGMLDAHWHANARSVLLLTRYFAEQFAPDGDHAAKALGERAARVPQDELASGRVLWMTSGQMQAPMPGEVAYATSKAALAGVTATVASELLGRNIILNTINPGPVNTGYMDPGTADCPFDELLEIQAAQPFGRFGQPDDVGRLVAWLMSQEARWIVGQVINSQGGFRL